MRIKYPKEFIKSDGRKLLSGGPRDSQQRQKQELFAGSTNIIIEELITQIKSLKGGYRGESKSGGYFTAEEVDEEIRKAVEQTLVEATPSLQKYKLRLAELQERNDLLKDKIKEIKKDNKDFDVLKKEINMLKQIIVDKEELIEVLKTQPAIIDGVTVGVERPQMEQQFIDPLEKDAGRGLKSHIDIKDISYDKKENMNEKVDKLKKLVGNLPKR